MHGGDIYRNKVELDFSVNINPFGMPESVASALHEAVDKSINYPDISYAGLKKAISKMLGVKKENILCGNGSSELFPAIVRAVCHCRANWNGENSCNRNYSSRHLTVMIPVPSFSGYERAARACNADIVFYEMKQEDNFCLSYYFLESLDNDIDIVFLANPNNPTGSIIKTDLLEKILYKCRKNNIFIVLDECFIEFVNDYEKFSFIKRFDEFDNLIIVRSFTKIFAIPGVRLGYLVCDNFKLIEEIKSQLPEWNISVFAQSAGIAAAKEKEYIENTVRYVEAEKDFLMQSIKNMGITVYPGHADFLFFYTEFPIAKKLLEQGILIRDCSDFRGLTQGYYRICVRNREDNERLINVVRDVICG